MIRIDDSLLEEIGLISLPKPDRDQMLRQIYETLEMRVGMRLAERMTDQQLDEFERFIDTNDEAGALKWLETNFPDYKQVVADELEKLKGEIKKDSSKILETMQQQSMQIAESAPMPPNSPVQSHPNPGVVAQQPQTQPVAPQQWSAAPLEPVQQQSSFQNPAPEPQPFAQPYQPTQPIAPTAPAAPAPVQPLTPVNPSVDNTTPADPQTQQNDTNVAKSSSGPSIPPPPSF